MTEALEAGGAWLAAHRPLAAIGLTLLGYAIGHAIWRRGRCHPLLNPTLIGILLVAGTLIALGADYGRYFEDAGPLHLLLGPAVVALAVPLHRHLPALRARAGALGLALASGSLAAVAATLAVAALLGAGEETLVSLAPKSATTAVSMAVSAETGGIPALTAVVTVLAGITGALAAAPLLDRLGVRDPIARGFGMGVASHGIATARAFQESEATGTAAGLAMGLNAVLTALLVPVVLRLWG